MLYSATLTFTLRLNIPEETNVKYRPVNLLMIHNKNNIALFIIVEYS